MSRSLSRKVTVYAILSQLVLLMCLISCSVIEPKYWRSADEGGITNYSTGSSTWILFLVAFSVGGFLLTRSARAVSCNTLSSLCLKCVLYALGVLFFLVLVTSYGYQLSNNALLDNMHVVTYTILFCVQTLAAGWFAFVLARNGLNILLLLGQLVAFAILVLTLFLAVLHLLFVGEALMGIMFGVLLVRTLACTTC